jgi:hypothetical protein
MARARKEKAVAEGAESLTGSPPLAQTSPFDWEGPIEGPMAVATDEVPTQPGPTKAIAQEPTMREKIEKLTKELEDIKKREEEIVKERYRLIEEEEARQREIAANNKVNEAEQLKTISRVLRESAKLDPNGAVISRLQKEIAALKAAQPAKVAK